MQKSRLLAVSTFFLFTSVPLVRAQVVSDVITDSNEFKEEGYRIDESQFGDLQGVSLPGGATVKAGLSTAAEYESNVFWTQDDKKADIINVTSPMIFADIPFGLDQRHLVQMMYDADIGTFGTYHSQNYVNQTAIVNGDFTLPFGYINAQDDFDHTTDRSATEFTQRVLHTDNAASTAVGIQLNRFAFETGYLDSWVDYDTDAYKSFDHRDDMVSETVYYQLQPKTQALMEYDHDFITYLENSSRDGYFNQVRVGLKGNVTGKTQLLFKIGYQDRTYDTEGMQGFEGLVVEAGSITQFSERTQLTLKFVRQAVESVYSNDNYYTQNYFSADLAQKLIGRFGLDLTTDVGRDVYPDVDPVLFQIRQDTIVDESIGLTYDIKEWMSAKIGYTFREDMSNIGGLSYNDNVWFLKFTAKI